MQCVKTRIQLSYSVAKNFDLSYSTWRRLSVLSAANISQRKPNSQVIGDSSSQTDFHSARCGLLRPTSSVTSLLMLQKRHITLETFENYFSPDVYPIGLAMQYLESVHSLTGLPYSVTIGICTILLRLAIGLPLQIITKRTMNREQVVQTQAFVMRESFKAQIEKLLAEDKTLKEKDLKFTMRRKIKDTVRRQRVKLNCHPAKAFLYPMLQIPVWLSMSLALRNMSGSRIFGFSAILNCPEMIHEGALWFPNLLVPDATMILPVMIGSLHLLNNEISWYKMKNPVPSKLITFSKWMGRATALVFIPIACVVPTAVSVYWAYSAVTATAVTLLFKWKKARTFLKVEPEFTQQQYFHFFKQHAEKESGVTIKRPRKS